jgi:hypothetical protein
MLGDFDYLAGFLGACGIRGRLQATVNDAQGVLARQDALVNERLEETEIRVKAAVAMP